VFVCPWENPDVLPMAPGDSFVNYNKLPLCTECTMKNCAVLAFRGTESCIYTHTMQIGMERTGSHTQTDTLHLEGPSRIRTKSSSVSKAVVLKSGSNTSAAMQK